MSKKGLGRGLQALIPAPEVQDQGVREILLERIESNPRQPRRQFDSAKLQELAESISAHGVVQPIVLRSKGPDRFEIVAGERRFRACQLAGLKTVPALVRECSDAEMAEIALLENIQREDLNPIEEANACRSLIEEYGFTQESLASRIGKSRPFVANLLRLLTLPVQAQRYLAEGKISVGHAKVLLALEDKSLLMLALEKVVRSGLSVRETEALVKSILDKTQPEQQKEKTPKQEEVDPIVAQIEDRLRGLLRTQVKIKALGAKGKIEIEYYSKEELNQIVDTLLGELS